MNYSETERHELMESFWMQARAVSVQLQRLDRRRSQLVVDGCSREEIKEAELAAAVGYQTGRLRLVAHILAVREAATASARLRYKYRSLQDSGLTDTATDDKFARLCPLSNWWLQAP